MGAACARCASITAARTTEIFKENCISADLKGELVEILYEKIVWDED